MNARLLFSITLGAAVMAGCDEGTTTAVADKAAEAASSAAESAKGMAADAAEMLKDPKAAFDKLQGLIDTKKWSDAKGLLDKLMALKDKLPAEWSSKLESLSKLVEDGAKSMGGK